MSIADNRKHVARLRKKRSKYNRCGEGNVAVGKITITPKQCNCWMCKNPRKVYKVESFQELRQKQLHSEEPE